MKNKFYPDTCIYSLSEDFHLFSMEGKADSNFFVLSYYHVNNRLCFRFFLQQLLWLSFCKLTSISRVISWSVFSRMIVPSQMQTPQNTMGTGSSNYTQMGPTGIPQSTYMQNIPGPTNPQMQQQIRQQRLMAMKRQSMSNPGQQPGPPQQQNAALMAQMQQQMAPNQYGNYPNQQRF